MQMRYIYLIYTQEDIERTEAEEARSRAGHMAVMSETSNRGILSGAEPLMPTTTATTVRARDGKLLVTDGPFAETKEQLAGYYIIDCENLDEAIQWASKIPTGCGGGEGSIEIRPIRPLTAKDSYDIPNLQQVGNGSAKP